MDEVKYVRESGMGLGAGALALLGVAGLAGLGFTYALSRNNWGGGNCCCIDPYLIGENNGQVKAGIACNAAGISRLECAVNQLQNNQLLGAMTAAGVQSVINSQNVNQQKTDAGLAVIANQIGQTNAVINRAMGNCFVWSKDLCPTTTTTPTAAA